MWNMAVALRIDILHRCSLAERKLRETIEAELNEDLSERKALIREEVHEHIDQCGFRMKGIAGKWKH